jgi:hypothetical protein
VIVGRLLFITVLCCILTHRAPPEPRGDATAHAPRAVTYINLAVWLASRVGVYTRTSNQAYRSRRFLSPGVCCMAMLLGGDGMQQVQWAAMHGPRTIQQIKIFGQ